MTQQEILRQNWTKTAKAKALYSLGYTRHQVADLLCNGNYGFAHNIWKKWNEEITQQSTYSTEFNFEFNRTFGIELEIYNVSRETLVNAIQREGINIVSESYNHTTRNHWKIVSDGSVTGSHGCEIVSPVLKGMEGMEQIKKVCIALNKVKAKVNKSCGFHVHFGVNDYNLQNFKNLIFSYAQNESNIDAFMPNSRRKNNNRYCKNITNINSLRTKLNRASSVSDICVDVFGAERYYKLNMQSFQRHGTVEFRQHSGTTTFSKIKNWILICGRMVEFAKQVGKFNNINDVLNESLQDYISDRAVDLVA
ncbi:amidoligase family protein [Riemerella anatipestifer]|uniref:amidoligase family protein n=1 Tax=Riemerella anatipestifer TaxID=34085 RepID=UPI00129EF558|nr:amidoligase family protein [Riemerella anatipestifer]MRM96423.1 amidoligase enzyme [Riemerella anatipestifer]